MKICVVSFNAQGLCVGHSEADKSHHIVVDKLLETCDILCVQETFLAKKDFDRLNAVHTRLLWGW